ncbi:AraC family transcriptional regulator [Paenibacillus aurantiacus]|uniref:AraC family transcriptional regulator n=1 Tax=Paenibacillus aurantiacus TaxID=1936118 RepID=A0ABV5L120_9BACL
MSSVVLTCGYSYHTQRFHDHYSTGLPCYLFRLQTEGRCEADIAGRRVSLATGDLLMLPPGTVYGLHVGEQNAAEGSIASGDYYLLTVSDWLDDWWGRADRPLLARIDPDEKLLGLWRLMIAEKRRQADESEGGPVSGELIDYLLRTLCLYLERAVTETAAPSAPPPFAVLRLKRFIEENATGRFKIDDAARHAGLSVSRAVHLFKEHVGRTMMDYATEVRLSAALERMKYTSFSLHQIAENCGFGEYSYFHKVFKLRYGTPPGEFRKRIRENESGTNLL